ncbi:GNAT superfamily N-acetyltransferase [Nocardioides sp. BE266]|uniref:GNAT family N-acetyltransferase n=1 Tax=Nocardioides sp. BE266 TaxID=2817725 RepID=UPI002857E7D3|nr:GNAT family N-acetyltransferase [Nocardioides sp. BE266]MDR7253449.1 GNAT superfamily N-acetyltransferase [Nocardioides sp. BE266]
MTDDHLLAAYDDQLRREGEVGQVDGVVSHGPLMWAVFDHGGFVTYRDLGGLDGADLDALIEETIAYFRDDTEVASFEWKSRGHDLPADLGDRLVAHGFEAEPRETVMIGEATLLAVDVPLAGGIVVRQAGDGADLRDDVTRMLAMQGSVFGSGRGPSVESSLADLEGGDTELWLAEVDGQVVCAGRLAVVPGTEFAGIWGGSTLPEFRGRGIYRALVTARARSAVARGVRYINSDCTDMSRPILERSGLRAVTTTTPYVWTR